MTESPTKSLGERREQGRERARECEGGRKVGRRGKGGEGRKGRKGEKGWERERAGGSEGVRDWWVVTLTGETLAAAGDTETGVDL